MPRDMLTALRQQPAGLAVTDLGDVPVITALARLSRRGCQSQIGGGVVAVAEAMDVAECCQEADRNHVIDARQRHQQPPRGFSWPDHDLAVR
jgi:hypothetical protein